MQTGMTSWKWLAGLLFLALGQAQDPLPAFQRVSGLPQAVTLRRIRAGDSQDLVVALASSHKCNPAPRPCWWNTKDRLGILLQDPKDPDRIQTLAVEPGPNDDCSTRVERFTLQELVLSCTGEKWSTYDNQKFVYNLASRVVVSHFSYAPFRAERSAAGPQFVMAAGDRKLVVNIDPVGIPRVTAATPPPGTESDGNFGPGGVFHLSRQKNRYGSEYPMIVGPGKIFELPQTDEPTWRRDRPDEAGSPRQIDPAEENEQIGPYQVADGLLWFGKTFYNSEGFTGVGGFGWFDPGTASFHLIASSEIHAWSVSAILVEQDAVWLALYRRGEYGNYPGGLLRWDRQSSTLHHWDMPWIASSLARGGDALYMGATDGIAVLRGDRIASYFVDRAADGQYRMAPRN